MTIQKIAIKAGLDDEDMEDYYSLEEQIENAVNDGDGDMAEELCKKASPKLLKKMIVDGTLCPSQWTQTNDEYPGFLAKILVTTKANESLTDVCNTYYSSDRILSSAAKKIFMADILSNKKQTIYIVTLGDGNGDGMWPNGWLKFVKAEPKTAKQVVLMLPKKYIAAIENEDNDNHEEWVKTKKLLKL